MHHATEKCDLSESNDPYNCTLRIKPCTAEPLRRLGVGDRARYSIIRCNDLTLNFVPPLAVWFVK